MIGQPAGFEVLVHELPAEADHDERCGQEEIVGLDESPLECGEEVRPRFPSANHWHSRQRIQDFA